MPDLPEDAAALIAAARDAADKAYAPYSGFNVGAAVRTADGRLFAAANVENASYGLSLCAETNAIMAAAVAGARDIVGVAVVGYRAAERDVSVLATPCGRCRQVINEFAAPGIPVYISDRAGEDVLSTTLGALLPHAFGPDRLAG